MKNLFKAAFAAIGLLASTLSYGAVVSIDFNSLPLGSVTPSTPVALNSFTTLSTDGDIFIGSSAFGGGAITIGGANTGDAIFSFDTSAVTVSSITLAGRSNNAPVTITIFDLAGDVLESVDTDNAWEIGNVLSSTSPIGSFSVLMLESEIESISITYEAVTAVPVPAALWLFGSGLIGLAGIARRKQA